MILAFLLLITAGCQHRKEPQTIYEQARLTLRQGNLASAMAMAEPPAKLRDSDFAIRRKLTQALALANTQRLSEAAEAISQAESIAEVKHPELKGEVAVRRGTVCFIANDLGCAESSYRVGLQSARERHDPFSEASALSGLGIVSTRLGHYDQAVEWNRAALEVAQSAGARSATGNKSRRAAATASP